MLAVESDSHQLHDDMPDEELLTSVCAGLVVADQNGKVIRLVHYSTEECFKRIRSTKFQQFRQISQRLVLHISNLATSMKALYRTKATLC